MTPLDDDLVQHAKVVAHTVRDTLSEWCACLPVSDEAAVEELFAYAALDVAARQQ
ncbi:hypothetical protein ACFYXC_40570 [Streptomyces sp. NPDC002701]|uniref:hypothetical protein n=1 Tax=Streptomyces sp. NPDC002701 TaxID=3364661 RepID=UPI0036768F2E